jgi:hypothetical protein
MRRALLSCVLLLAFGMDATGCAAPDGVQVEGRARQVSPPPTAPSLPSSSPVSADAVAVLRADPHINTKVKATLAPCEGGQYPLDQRYTDLTGDGRAELVVTVLGCPVKAMAPGPLGHAYAGYVYNLRTEPPTRLLGVEEAGVELLPNTGSGHDLAVLHSRYTDRDDPCCPTDQWITIYRWNGTALVPSPR